MTYDYNPSQSVARRPFQLVRRSQAAYNLIYRGVTLRVDPNVNQTSDRSRASILVDVKS